MQTSRDGILSRRSRQLHPGREEHKNGQTRVQPAHQNSSTALTLCKLESEPSPLSTPSISPSPNHSADGFLVNMKEPGPRNGYHRNQSFCISPSASAEGEDELLDAECEMNEEQMDDEGSFSFDGGPSTGIGHSQASLRVRSLISDMNFRLLKSFYDLNPWPKKSDLHQLANRCGLKRRVVQVSLF